MELACSQLKLISAAIIEAVCSRLQPFAAVCSRLNKTFLARGRVKLTLLKFDSINSIIESQKSIFLTYFRLSVAFCISVL